MGAVGSPDYLERRLHPRRLLVGVGAGFHQCEPWVREHLTGPRRAVLQARTAGGSSDDHRKPAAWDVGQRLDRMVPAVPQVPAGSALHDAVVAGPNGSSFVSATTVV